MREAAREGLQDGGRQRPQDIEFAEVHDCFTIAEIIATEDLGFVKKGEGGPYALEGRTGLTRRASRSTPAAA